MSSSPGKANRETDMRIAVLGAGMVGRAIVRDLAHEAHVTVIDVDQQALDRLAEDVP